MLERFHRQSNLQLLFGLLIGIAFGFLLQKGGVTNYNIILGQLLLVDFTVLKIMLTAVLTGMIGVHLLQRFGLARLQPKSGSVGSSVVGGLIFGVGFGVLGYCPGTIAGALGQGFLDAMFGGVAGILLGAGLYAAFFPRLQGVLAWGDFGAVTLPQLFKVNPWVLIVPVAGLIVLLLWWFERLGV